MPGTFSTDRRQTDEIWTKTDGRTDGSKASYLLAMRSGGPGGTRCRTGPPGWRAETGAAGAPGSCWGLPGSGSGPQSHVPEP